MSESEGVPADERLPVPKGLDRHTLQVIADLWNEALAGVSGELMLSAHTPPPRDYSTLHGEELDAAVRELIGTGIGTWGACNGDACPVFRGWIGFGRQLSRIIEVNGEG